MGEPARLPDEALVVRCGRPPYDAPRPLHERCDEHAGVYGFSVQSRADLGLKDLAAACRNNRIGLLTVGIIRKLGYDVVITPGRGYHATVIVPRDWTPAQARILGARFEERDNPVPKAERKPS